MARIGKLGAAAVAAGMMLLGISSSAYAAPRSPSAEITSATGDLSTTEKAIGEIRAGGVAGSAEAGLAPAAETPFSCQVNIPSMKGSLQYDTGSPSMLTDIKWTGSGTATCTIPMASISYTLFAGVAQGDSHTIAAGSCTGCSAVTALDKGYTCVQGTTIDANCAGVWTGGYRVDITPPAGKEFASTSGSCSRYGAGVVCYSTAPQGFAPLFAPVSPCTKASALDRDSARQTLAAASAACYNNPPSGSVSLSLQAISNIRDYHFPGGSHVDDTKGLFLPKITNRDLGNILDTGLQDSGPWVLI